MKIRLMIILVLVLLLQLPQTCWSVDDSLKMKAFGIAMAGATKGYKLSKDLSSWGKLRNGNVGGHKLELKADIEYLIAGVCDDDCKDLDLILFDGDTTNVVEHDVETRDPPVIYIKPKRTGSFTLGIKMSSCTVSPCSLGIMVMEK